MRIGYIIQDFPPEVGAGPARVTEMARHWLQAGAAVTVLTGFPSRRLPGIGSGSVHPQYRGRWFMEESWQGIDVLRSWVYNSRKNGFARTVMNNASFMASAAAQGMVRARDLDVVIASSPPFFPHLTGTLLAHLQRAPLFLELRDLWPDYLVEMGMLRASHPATRALFRLEKRLLTRADRVIVVTESFRKRVIAKGVAPERVHVIPNGVDTTAYCRVDAEAPIARPPGAAFVAGYLGTFGAGQGLESLLAAAALLRDRRPDIFIMLVGDGPRRAAIEQRARELGLPNLSVHPPIERSQTCAFYNSCDICLIPLAPIPVFQETIPSKIFEVMACERPMLVSAGGEARRIVDESGGGIAVPPGDAPAIADALVRLADNTLAEREVMGQRGRSYVIRNYDRARLAEQYLELMRAAVQVAA